MAQTSESRDQSALLEPTCDLERVAIIFNPVSGTEDSAGRRSALEALAHDAGLSCNLEETDRDRGATPLAEQAIADDRERLIVSGGDGSITEAAHVLAGTATALAVVPAGTGNLLALNLGIPTDREAAMRLALTGEAKPIDVGRANGQVFLIATGMGLDARMIHEADREMKRKYGKLAYFITGWRNLRRHRVDYRITVDGQVLRRRAETVMIANLGRITAGLELVPGSDPDDGLLEVAILRTRRLRDLALLGLRMLVGRPRSDDLLEVRRGRHIRVQARQPQPVQLDGNDAGTTAQLDVQVEPGVLKLVRPEPPLEPPVIALAATVVPHLWPRVTAAVGAIALVYGLRRWWGAATASRSR